MYAKTINLLCEGAKVFVKYQAQGGFQPHPPLAYALLRSIHCESSRVACGT